MFRSNVIERTHSMTAAQPVELQATPVSFIGSGMSIVGNVECIGPAQVFGRVEGELRATELAIGEGAQIKGSVVAQEVTVSGSVKGSIRAIRVKLQGGTVEGEIIHRTLSIDDSSIFDGMSRRVENLTDRRPDDSQDAVTIDTIKSLPKQVVSGPSLVPSAHSLGNGSHPPN